MKKYILFFFLFLSAFAQAQSVDQIIQTKIDAIGSAISRKYDSIISIRDNQIAALQKTRVWYFDSTYFTVSAMTGGYKVSAIPQINQVSNYSSPLIQTWNTTNDTFVTKMNVINNGSTERSGYVMYQVNGWNEFSVDLYGKISNLRQDMPTGVTGNQTLWAVAGSVNIAAGTRTVTITDDRLGYNNQVLLQVLGTDVNLKTATVSYNYPLRQFTITGNANAYKETRIAFTISGSL